jgi:tRNA (guanine-N7-)-methyltransferase
LPVSPDEEFVHDELRLEQMFPAAGSRTPAPLEIEFGSGKGRFLIESGRLHPERHFLGVERSLAYYRIARDRIAKAHFDRVRVIRADAAKIVELLPESSVDAFHAYFLDPWPKKKQRKRRLLGPAFLAAAAARARAGASFRIITDHEDYGDAIADAVHRAIEQGAPWKAAVWDSLPTPPPTHYELKYRAAGRSFRRFLLIRE